MLLPLALEICTVVGDKRNDERLRTRSVLRHGSSWIAIAHGTSPVFITVFSGILSAAPANLVEMIVNAASAQLRCATESRQGIRRTGPGQRHLCCERCAQAAGNKDCAPPR